MYIQTDVETDGQKYGQKYGQGKTKSPTSPLGWVQDKKRRAQWYFHNIIIKEQHYGSGSHDEMIVKYKIPDWHVHKCARLSNLVSSECSGPILNHSTAPRDQQLGLPQVPLITS